MQMYIHYYDHEVRLIDENPIIGILLCQDKNDAVMKMMLLANNEQIFASKYKTVLPITDELKRILSEVNNDE